MESLLIIGAGGFATEVEELAESTGSYSRIAFLDDNIKQARCSPVIGTLSAIEDYYNIFTSAIVAIGNNELRMKLHKRLIETGYQVPILVHPSAYVSPDSKIECGCIIREKAVIGRYSKLCNGVIVNAGAIVDHDCIVGDFSHLLVGAVVRNSKVVPNLTLLKANSVFE